MLIANQFSFIEVRETSWFSWQIAPNPINGPVSIQLELPKNLTGKIDLLDVSGRQVQTLFEGKFNKGMNTIQHDLSGLPKGQYLVRMESREKIMVEKIILL